MTQRGMETLRVDQGSRLRTVADIMRRDVVAVSPETSVQRAARVLLDHETPGLPVVDRAGRVVGILREEDLMARLGPRVRRPWWHFLAASDQLAREFRRSAGSTVADVMTQPALTASSALPLAAAASLFDAPSVCLVAVVADDRLIGTISRSDLVKGLVASPPNPCGRVTRISSRGCRSGWRRSTDGSRSRAPPSPRVTGS